MNAQYIQDLINRLSAITEADDDLNVELGRLVGYTPADQDKDNTGMVLWLDPGGSPTRLPLFTHSLDAARMFSERILPQLAGGVSWGGGEPANARFDNNPTCSGANEAIALCNATLTTLLIKARAMRSA